MSKRESFRRVDAEAIKSLRKEDLEITTGFTVGDLSTVEECSNAVHLLQGQIDGITVQLARQTEGIIDKGAVWRNSAQNAIRWKKRVITAINERKVELHRAAPKVKSYDRMRAIINAVRMDVGERRMDDYVEMARRQSPHLFDDIDETGG